MISHGTWWTEIGGEGAFFNARPEDHFAAGPWPWLLTTRFDPDAPTGSTVRAWADRLGSQDHVEASFNTRQDPETIHSGSEQAPQLPGGWYLFEQGFPVPGCWRLSAAIDGNVVGTAVVKVANGASSYLPLGTFMTEKAIGGEPCFAFAIAGYSPRETATVDAWSWEQGASGDCQTRTSDLISSKAKIVPRTQRGYDVVLGIPRISGQTEIRVSLYSSGGALAGVAVSNGNASVFFTQVSEVQPALASFGS